MAIGSAKGTLMKVGDGTSPEVFSTISQVRSISGPSTTATVQDITTHSTAGNWMEKLATLIDPGAISFPLNFDPADAAHAFSTGMWNDMINLTQSNYQMVFPAGFSSQLAFAAYLTNHSFDAPVDNVLQATIELTINGAIVGTTTP